MVQYYYDEFLSDARMETAIATFGATADAPLRNLMFERDQNGIAFAERIGAVTSAGVQPNVKAAQNDGHWPPIPVELVADTLQNAGITPDRITGVFRQMGFNYTVFPQARAAETFPPAQQAPGQWTSPGGAAPRAAAVPAQLPPYSPQVTYGQPVANVTPVEHSGGKSHRGRFVTWASAAVAGAAVTAGLVASLSGLFGSSQSNRTNDAPVKPDHSTSISTGNGTPTPDHADVYFNTNSAGAPIVSTLINGQTANEPDAGPASIQAAIKSAAGSGASNLIISGDPIISGNQARQVEALLEEAAQTGELNGLKSVTISPVSANPGDVKVAIDTISKAAKGLEIIAVIKSTDAPADSPACYVASPDKTPANTPNTVPCNTR